MVSKKKAVELVNKIIDLYPDAHCELLHTNAFELLIAVLLSAQSTDAGVNKVTPALFKTYPTPTEMSTADINEIENYLRKIGLYKNKAKHVKELSTMLVTDFKSEVPSKYEDLIKLAGVGRKTANVVLSVWFNEPRIAVDTHVERVSKRLKLARIKDNVLEVEEKLMYLLPESMWSKAHHAIIFFGRYHCTAKKPSCSTCPLFDSCGYAKKNDYL